MVKQFGAHVTDFTIFTNDSEKICKSRIRQFPLHQPLDHPERSLIERPGAFRRPKHVMDIAGHPIREKVPCGSWRDPEKIGDDPVPKGCPLGLREPNVNLTKPCGKSPRIAAQSGVEVQHENGPVRQAQNPGEHQQS